MHTRSYARTCLTAVLVATIVGVWVLPASGQLFGRKPVGSEDSGTPRVSLPSGHLLPQGRASTSFAWTGAQYQGRDMNSKQYGVAVGVTPRIELAWDRHTLDFNGRTAGNEFDARATGYQVRYGQELFGNDGALFLQYRRSKGEVRQGGALRIPPAASTYTVGASASHPFGERNDLHFLGSLSFVDVGNESAQSWTVGAGLDHHLSKAVTLQGNVALTKETGDASGTEIAISGGAHYETRSGLYADVMGGFLPTGVPIAGHALADGSVFVLDPVFRAEPIVQQFQDDSLGFYSIRVGYTTPF